MFDCVVDGVSLNWMKFTDQIPEQKLSGWIADDVFVRTNTNEVDIGFSVRSLLVLADGPKSGISQVPFLTCQFFRLCCTS